MEGTPHHDPASEENLDSPSGMFYMEISHSIHDVRELLDASLVEESKKEECRKILEYLMNNSAEKKRSVTDICYYTVLQLKNILRSDNDEENQLFESMRDTIYRARNSALGWENK